MKKVSEFDQLDIGKEYYLEMRGVKLKAYITDMSEKSQSIKFSFPCLLSGDGYFGEIWVESDDIDSDGDLVSDAINAQIRELKVKYDTRKNKFFLTRETYYLDEEDDDNTIDKVVYSFGTKVHIYEPTRDKIIEKNQQTSLAIVMDKYGFPELSTYTEGFL